MYFGEKASSGGLCFIEATLEKHETVCQEGPAHQLMLGERSGKLTPFYHSHQKRQENDFSCRLCTLFIIELLLKSFVFVFLLDSQKFRRVFLLQQGNPHLEIRHGFPLHAQNPFHV